MAQGGSGIKRPQNGVRDDDESVGSQPLGVDRVPSGKTCVLSLRSPQFCGVLNWSQMWLLAGKMSPPTNCGCGACIKEAITEN